MKRVFQNSGWACLISCPAAAPIGRMRKIPPRRKFISSLEGEITVQSKDGEIVLRKGDSLFIGPNEGRSMKNKTNQAATILVVITYA
jgi:quercetin dioxygenase-like cupin family protein